MSESKREVIQAGRKLLLEIGGSDAECWAQNDKTYERATELADMVAQLVGYPQRDEDGECFYPEEPSTPEPAAVDRAALTKLAAYLEKTAANCEDLHGVAWENSEVLEMVGQIRALLAPALVAASPDRYPAVPKENP